MPYQRRYDLKTAKRFMKFLQANGWERKRKTGSHVQFNKTGIPKVVTVPENGKISENVIMQGLRNAGLKKEDFWSFKK